LFSPANLVFLFNHQINSMSNYKYEDQLSTERLNTRNLTMDDLSTWTKFFEDEDQVEFLPNVKFETAEQRGKNWIEKQLGRYKHKTYGLQALIHKQTGEFIGQCGLLLQEVDGKNEVEVGYHIFKKYWGQGYAPEAAKMFLEYGFKNKQAGSIVSIIHKHNIKSQRVAEKNGLKKEKETTWMELPIIVYRISQP